MNKLLVSIMMTVVFDIGLAVAQPATVPITTKSYTRYPSLEPVTAIDVDVSSAPEMLGAVQNALNANGNWDCTSADYYKVAIVDKSHQILREIPIKSVRPQPFSSLAPPRKCDGSGIPGTVDLILEYQVNTNDLLQVFMYTDTAKNNLFAKSSGSTSFTSGTIFTFTATPQSAPNEALNNGKNRDVGQLSVALADTNLLPDSPVNIYAKSTDLFSTDGKDAKSAFSGVVGLQRGIFSKWYAPLYLEQGVQGNQTASNMSTVTNLGINSLLPWQWSKDYLNAERNMIVRVPLPPDFSLVNQYTHRINQLVTAKTPRLSDNDYSLNPSMSWKSITSPATCKLFSWLNQSRISGYCLGTELNLGLWYLPLDLTKVKSQRVEGYGDVSILLPLAGFSFASKVFPYISSADPTKVQIRIKYSDSVNAANNYARSRQWTYGVEVLK